MSITINIDGSLLNWSKVGDVYKGTQYKLRAGPPMPISSGGFKLHTFKAEVCDVESSPCTESLPGSEEFRGQGGSSISASFSRLNIKGGNTFQGRTVKNLRYEEEGSVFTYI